MDDISKTLYEQLPKITRNRKEYQNKGYSITFDMIKQNFSIRYNKCLYKVKMTKLNNKWYWHLKPYNDSYFTTKVDNPKSFDVVLFAIKDNECYKHSIKSF